MVTILLLIIKVIDVNYFKMKCELLFKIKNLKLMKLY